MPKPKLIYMCCFLLLVVTLTGQQAYSFTVDVQPEECQKGTASLFISGLDDNDVLSTNWSNGQINVSTANELVEGDYSVNVVINSTADSIITDTSLTFTVRRQLCEVIVASHFTPNGDGYNDVLGINYADRHPNFLFEVYNRWGQRVYIQRSVYLPWDGKSFGIDVADGTYYYIFFYDADNKQKFVKGSITLVR